MATYIGTAEVLIEADSEEEAYELAMDALAQEDYSLTVEEDDE